MSRGVRVHTTRQSTDGHGRLERAVYRAEARLETGAVDSAECLTGSDPSECAVENRDTALRGSGHSVLTYDTVARGATPTATDPAVVVAIDGVGPGQLVAFDADGNLAYHDEEFWLYHDVEQVNESVFLIADINFPDRVYMLDTATDEELWECRERLGPGGVVETDTRQPDR